ncbi:hypothetical protein COS75_01215 [Candidatus Pacearchaeota archaeon CG06_land_8_20_14_3_00_35_12]|nr:MAG: hypothetical protein COS75_01215 [Candidatus Pacearchaeota archaeon CG06_land_8_20_14_3_00_35_12]
MVSSWFIEAVPPLRYLLYNVGFILLTILIFGVPLTYVIHQKLHLFKMIKYGFSSWLAFSFLLDIWQPPLAWGANGTLLITNLGSLVGTSVDYMSGWFWLKVFPSINQIFIGKISLLFVFVYFLTPILIAFIIALILRPKELARLFLKQM